MTATQTTTAATNLDGRAMLVDLTIKKWTASSRDKAVTTEVTNAHGASADVGHFYKQLVDKRFTAELDSIVTAAYTEHRRRTVPYMDDGRRLLGASGFDGYRAAMNAYEARYMQAARDLAAKWDEAVEDGLRRQGSMGKRSDYPTERQLLDRYAFGFVVFPVPMGQDLRLDLADEQVARIRAEIDATTRAAYEATVAHAADRIKDVIGRMVHKLTETRVTEKGTEPAIFRDSLVYNVRDLVDILPSLNITANPRLEELTAKLRELCTVSPAQLRANDRTRVETAKAAQAILDEASTIEAEAAAIADKMGAFI